MKDVLKQLFAQRKKIDKAIAALDDNAPRKRAKRTVKKDAKAKRVYRRKDTLTAGAQAKTATP